jgi:hypothetical protein
VQQLLTVATALRPQPLDAGDDDVWQVLVGERFTDDGTRRRAVAAPQPCRVLLRRPRVRRGADRRNATRVFECARGRGVRIDVDAPIFSRARKPRRPRAIFVSSAPDRPGGASGLKPLDFATNYITSGAPGAPGAPGAVVSVTTQTITLQPQRVRRVSCFGLFGTTTFWLLFGRETKIVFCSKSRTLRKDFQIAE